MKNNVFIALFGIGMLVASSAHAYNYRFINKSANEPIDVQYSVGLGESPTNISIPAQGQKDESVGDWKIGLCFDWMTFKVQINKTGGFTPPIYVDEALFNEIIRTHNSMSAFEVARAVGFRAISPCGNKVFMITRTVDFKPVVLVKEW